MKLDEFKSLEESKKVELINKRLGELLKEKKSTKEFRCSDLDFSYTTATREMEKLGYAREGKQFTKEFKLTEREITKLKALADIYESIMQLKKDKPEVKKRDDVLTTTSMRMYNDVWTRWQCFTREWNIYNSPDLMASALEDYMNKFDFEDLETLKKMGKVK